MSEAKKKACLLFSCAKQARFTCAKHEGKQVGISLAKG
jgi:hypothetical protein